MSWRITAIATLSVLSASGRALADAPALTEGDRAVELGKEGLAAFRQGRWTEAFERFSAANARSASPVFLLYMARALGNAGKLLDARKHLRAIAATTLGDDAPQSWRMAQVDASAELQALERRIPSIVVDPGSAGSWTGIEVDGVPGRLGAAVEVDPGPHRVRAHRNGHVFDRTVSVPEGAIAMRVVLVPAPGLGAAPPNAAALRGPTWPGFVVLGAGAAGLSVGSVLGVLALVRAGDARDRCTGNRCPESGRPRIEADAGAARDLGDASTATLLAGGAMVAAGVVLVTVRPFGGEASKKPALVLVPTPLGGAIRGAF